MAISFVRTLILYFIIIISLRILGKRQIGELQPSELVAAILISDLAAVPMQDLGIPLMQGLIPIFTIFSVEMLLSALSARSVRLRSILCGRTSILIDNGKINQMELKKLRLNITELLEELRIKDVFDLNDVSYAYLETNGTLSVQLKAPERPATAAQMNADTANEPELYTTIIAQGRVISTNLKDSGRNQKWLENQLKANKIKSPKDVYLMVLDNLGGVMVVPREHFNADSGIMEG